MLMLKADSVEWNLQTGTTIWRFNDTLSIMR